jgi:hypothetical protein
MNHAKPPNVMVPQIMWVAFLVSHGMFLLVGHMVNGSGAESNAADIELMAIVLTGVGILTALGSALGVPIFARGQPFFTVLILRMALAESATIFGLVLAMLGAEFFYVYVLTGLGVLAHLVAFPSEREIRSHEGKRPNEGSGFER